MSINNTKRHSISQTFIELLNKGNEVDIQVYGLSMFPFFLPGDSVRVKKVPIKELAKGDVVVFNGVFKLVAHRLIRIDCSEKLICKGDGLIYKDRPVSIDKYCGKVIVHFRNGRILSSSWFSQKLLAYISPYVGVVFFILGRIWYRFLK